jgi:hypothetical protein
MFTVGEKVFVRTVTHYLTGRLTTTCRAEDRFIYLVDAAWIADTGRYGDFLATGKASEVEPVPAGMEVAVNLGSIIDIYDWPHDLPREQV